MRDLYSDDYESVAGGGAASLIPDKLRRAAGAAVFLGLVAALGLWAYRLGTREATAVPIVRALEGPARVAPDDPGGLQAAHQGLEVNAVLAGRPAVEPPATPTAAAPPAVLAPEDAPQAELVAAAPAALAERVIAESGAAPMAADDAGGLAVPNELAALPAGELAVLGGDPALDVAALHGEPEALPAPEEQPAPAAGPRPMNRPANLARARPAPPQKPAARAVETVASRPAPAAAATSAASGSPGSGARLVQLGAFDSEGSTRKAWEQLVQRHPDLLGSKQLFVERTTANARVFYRLRVAGFQSSDQTREMCEALRARGIDCIPVTLN
jgi:hypothetical protein